MHFFMCIGGVLIAGLSNYFPFTMAGILFVCVLSILSQRKFLLLLLLSLSFLAAFLRQEPSMEPFSCPNATAEVISTSLPEEDIYGYRQIGTMDALDGCAHDITGRTMTLFTKDPIPPYSRILFSGTVKGVWLPRNPYNLVRTFAISGSVHDIHEHTAAPGLMRHINGLRLVLREAYRREFPEGPAGLISAIVIGDRSGLSDEMIHSFSITGLSHLLAISGTHFGVLSFLIFTLIRMLILRLPYSLLYRLSMYIKPSTAAALVSSPFMLFYLALSGMGIPAVRSFFMIHVVLLGLLLEKKASWKSSLLFAATVILLFSPTAVADTSFLLSFSAVAAIGTALEWRASRKKDDIPLPGDIKTVTDRAKERLTDMIFLTGSAIIGTLPLTTYFFHAIPLTAFPVNMIVTPFVCFILIPLLLFSSLFFLLTGFFPFASLIESMSVPILGGVKMISTIRFLNIPVAAFPVVLLLIALTGLALLFTGRARRAGPVLLCAFFILSLVYPHLVKRSHYEITFLDTGQAESAVMTMPDGKVFAVDTGRNGRYTSRYLDYLGVRTLDALFLSHGGLDHAGGVGYLLISKEIGTLFDNGAIIYDFNGAHPVRYRTLSRGNTIEGTGYTIETLHPYNRFLSFFSGSRADNNGSLVLRVAVDGYRFLFTGDIEAEAEQDMYVLGKYLESDVIKVAHHGSRTSTSAAFLSLSSPSIGIISSGKFNMYGHPHEETMSRLANIRTLNTAESGAVKISIEDGNSRPSFLKVKTVDEAMLRNVRTIGDELSNYGKLFMTW